MRQINVAASTALCATAALLATTVPATPALAATPVTCGMRVTTDITLKRDLLCPGPGLIVDADDVTIDLNGYTLAGSLSDVGIVARERVGLEITGGRITGFDHAILLSEVQDAVLRDLRLTGNTPIPYPAAGTLAVSFSENIQLLESQITQSPTMTAVFVEASRSVRVERLRSQGDLNWLENRGLSVSDSVFTDAYQNFQSSYEIDFRRNTLRRSEVSTNQVSTMTIADSHFSGPIGTAISLGQINDPVVERNRISGARNGIWLDPFAWGGRIAQNLISGNDYGVHLNDDFFSSLAPLITDNVFRGNRKAGIFLEVIPASRRASATSAVITRNDFVRNGHGSTEADVDAAGRRINDAIHTNLPAGTPLTISENQTFFNAGHGIEALPTGSVIDGGGNQSTGDPNGCAGVVCG